MKKITALLLLTGCLLLAPLPAQGAGPVLTAKAAVLVSTDGVVLWGKNLSFVNPPASTAKVMTALVICRNMNLDTWVRVSRKAERTEPTRVGIRAGEEFRVQDLLYALLMKSGNDVAVCLAEADAGTEKRFATLMTLHARLIGAKKTVFRTASGLPAPGQKTTVTDLARIMRQALKQDIIVRAMETATKTIKSRAGRKVTLKNHNRLLWDRRHAVVLKTGFTRASRHCYVGFIGPKGRDGVFAFLKARKPWDDARALSSFARGGSAKISFNGRNLSADTVRRLQKALKKHGFKPGPVDGIFGRKTLSALQSFQKSRGLQIDGLAGKQTLRKLGIKG